VDDPPFVFSFYTVIAIILLLIGCWYFSHIFGFLFFIKFSEKKEVSNPFLITLFLLSISLFIFGVIFYLSRLGGLKADIFDIATLWSAVYATIAGTFGLLKAV
jgi:hypothetical protein